MLAPEKNGELAISSSVPDYQRSKTYADSLSCYLTDVEIDALHLHYAPSRQSCFYNYLDDSEPFGYMRTPCSR